MKDKSAIPTSFLPDFCGGRTAFVVILVAELLAIVLTLAQPANTPDRLYQLAMYSMFIQWVALGCVASLCLARRVLNTLGDVQAATLGYGITLVVTLLVSEISWWLVSYWPAGTDLARSSHAEYLLRCMSISAIVSALALRYFYVQHQWRRRVELEAEARFQALQSRIRPHFLFNCMNTIASLTRRQPALAEESIEDLADLFRASLQDIHHVSTLADEVSLCRRYLRIEKHRLGERLRVDWALDDLPANVRIPALSLQPLLENAIYHGIETLAEGGCIEIRGQKTPGLFRISVENPLPANTSSAPQHGNQLAQENIRQRLRGVFGATASLDVEPGDQRYRVTISIPVDHEAVDR